MSHRSLDGSILLGTELDSSITSSVSVFYLLDGTLDIIDRGGKPDVGIFHLPRNGVFISVKRLAVDSLGAQSAIDIVSLIALGAASVGGTLHIFYMVGDAFHITAFVQLSPYCLCKLLFALAVSHFIVNKDLTHLQQVLVLPVIDAQHIQQARLGYFIFHPVCILMFILFLFISRRPQSQSDCY